MIIKSIEIQKFRSFENVSFDLGRRITAISGRKATKKIPPPVVTTPGTA